MNSTEFQDLIARRFELADECRFLDDMISYLEKKREQSRSVQLIIEEQYRAEKEAREATL